ncbi:MAG: DsrH/TusB family sulfur relay protein [Candidatus Thorarchaeota archaeon]
MEQKKNIVYLFGFSTRKEFYLENISKVIKEQLKLGASIKLVLIHDGVIGISNRGKKSNFLEQLLNLPILVFAVKPDLIARGISIDNIDKKVNALNYEELIDILAETPHIVSWM